MVWTACQILLTRLNDGGMFWGGVGHLMNGKEKINSYVYKCFVGIYRVFNLYILLLVIVWSALKLTEEGRNMQQTNCRQLGVVP
jgi:hypothetical protein